MRYPIALLIILFASFSDKFLFRVNIIPVEPSNFLIPLFFVLGALKYNIINLFEITKTHTFKLLLAFFFFSILYAPFSPAPSDVIIRDVTLNLITILLYIFSFQFFRNENTRFTIRVLLLSFIVLACSIWYDFFIGLPKRNLQLEELVRKGGFGENPNQAAAGLKFLALCILFLLRKNKTKRNLFIICAVASVFITFSRGGLVSILIILILGISNDWKIKFNLQSITLVKSFFKLIFFLLILYSGLLIFGNYIKEKFPAYTMGSAGERLDLILGQSESVTLGDDTGAENGRANLVIKFSNLFMDHPFGYGTSYSTDSRTFDQNTHNFYLYLGVNLGVLVLIIYLIYLLYSIRLSFKINNFFYFILFLLIIFEGLVSHYFFYVRAVLISLAFFDSYIYKENLVNKLIIKT